MKTIDGFTSAPPRPNISMSNSPPARRTIQQFAPRHYAKPKSKARRRPPQWLQMLLLGLGSIAIGTFIQSPVFGQLAIVAYGLVAFICKVPSRTTFTLAVLSLIATTWALVMQGNIGLAQNFATYTFLFLVVGVITLSRELKREGGRIYTSRKINTER